MKVYLVCETIDLGYHVVAGYFSKDRAENEKERLVNKAIQEKIYDLMQIGYNKEDAEVFARSYYYYELSEVEVE